MEELLYEFAEEQGISSTKVDRFLSRKKKIDTLEDLLNADSSLLEHKQYISFISRDIKDYIIEELHTNRYETVTLERIVDSLSLDYDDDDNLVPFEDSEHNNQYKHLIKALINSKFGSVKYDW